MLKKSYIFLVLSIIVFLISFYIEFFTTIFEHENTADLICWFSLPAFLIGLLATYYAIRNIVKNKVSLSSIVPLCLNIFFTLLFFLLIPLLLFLNG